MPRSAAVGVVGSANTAVLVTVASDGALLDRRQVELTERGTPTHPHHHEGSWAMGRYLDSPWARPVTLAEAIALVERVREASARGARRALDELAAQVSAPIGRIAIHACPALPETVEATIADARAQTYADSVMYRTALAEAARARGWDVRWYEKDEVAREAAAALGRADLGPLLREMGRAAGPPWQARHKLAATAALAASRG